MSTVIDEDDLIHNKADSLALTAFMTAPKELDITLPDGGTLESLRKIAYALTQIRDSMQLSAEQKLAA